MGLQRSSEAGKILETPVDVGSQWPVDVGSQWPGSFYQGSGTSVGTGWWVRRGASETLRSRAGCALALASAQLFLSRGGSVRNVSCDLNLGSTLHLVGLWELNSFTVFAFCCFLPLPRVLAPKEV